MTPEIWKGNQIMPSTEGGQGAPFQPTACSGAQSRHQPTFPPCSFPGPIYGLSAKQLIVTCPRHRYIRFCHVLRQTEYQEDESALTLCLCFFKGGDALPPPGHTAGGTAAWRVGEGGHESCSSLACPRVPSAHPPRPHLPGQGFPKAPSSSKVHQALRS